MEPIDPKNIFYLLQCGYAADILLGMAVDSLNGVRNRSIVAGLIREADPEFPRVVTLLRELQAAGAVSMRVEQDNSGSTAVILFRGEDIPAEVVESIAEIRRLLKMSPTAQRFALRYSAVRGARDELAVNSRSPLQIMIAYSSYVDVPEAHLRDHSALPTMIQTVGDTRQAVAMLIRSGTDRPTDAYAFVHYRGYWFWVDQADLRTKRAFGALMLLFSLANTGSKESLPLITIPAQ